MPEPPKETKTMLSPKIGGGPHGLGDPNDKTLRKVELDVLIPQKMRNIARDEKCTKEVAAFTECCKENNLMMVFRCRDQNSNLKACLTKWYQDDDFREHCKNLYLEERSEYRRTGIPKSKRQEQIKLGSARIGSAM